jgi:hypothetical protein
MVRLPWLLKTPQGKSREHSMQPAPTTPLSIPEKNAVAPKRVYHAPRLESYGRISVQTQRTVVGADPLDDPFAPNY